MKKVLSTLAPLKKIRPGKKAILVLGYLLVVAALITAVTMRNLPSEPATPAPSQPGTALTGTVEGQDVVPNVPSDTEGGPEIIDGVFPDSAEQPVLALPTVPMQWPLDGQILIGHHEVYRIGNQIRAHVGVDIEAVSGTDVLAAWPGIVEHVTKDPRLGWTLEIRHGGGYLTRYANLLEEPFVAAGDEVNTGHVVGKVGESAVLGASEGPYLNFAVFKDNQAIDPIEKISPR